jgi:hypothetical protein
MRYRLIRARRDANGWAPIWHVQGLVEARASAREAYVASGVPILLCEAPLGGILRALETVGGSDRRVRRA